MQDVKGVASATVSMSDTPLIVEIIGAGAAPPPTATTDTGGSAGTPPAILGVTTTPGNGGSVATGGVVTLTVTFSSTVTVAGGSPTLALSPGGVATYVSGSGRSALVFSYTVAAGQTAADLALATSNALALNGATIRGAAGNNAVLTGANGVNPARTVQINPATGGGAGGATTPNFITPGSGSFTDSAGNVYSIDAAGNAIENGTLIPDGDSTGAMEYSNGTVYGEYLTTGTWYTWNQSVWAGPAAAPPPPGTPPVSMTGGSAPAAPTITGTSGDDNIVATVNNTTINSGAGNDSIFLSGTGDVVTTGNGTNTVMGFVGGNTITTGSGNDIIRIGGSGSVVNAGPGVNMISDSGNGNTFVLPASGGTDNIFGYVLQNNGLFDLRPLLAATTWNGSQATVGHYLQTTASPDGANTMLVVTPTGGVAGASYTAATFNGSGVISLPTLLSHSLT